MSAQEFWGHAQVHLDGKLLAEARGSAKLEPGGRTRKTLATSNRLLGTIPGKFMPGAVEGDFHFTAGVDALEIKNAVNATVQFELDNGQRFVVRGAAQVAENPKIEGNDEGGRITGIRFEGQPAEPVTA